MNSALIAHIFVV